MRGPEGSILPLPMPGYRHVAPLPASAGGTVLIRQVRFVDVFSSPLWKSVDRLMR